MFRIEALNDNFSGSDIGSDNELPPTITKEAQESEALNLYNKALSLQRQGDHHGAEKVFHSILDLDFIQEAELPHSEGERLVQPGLKLKYSTCKNLGCMALQNEDYTGALEAFLQAVMIDWSDVTVWYKIGYVAVKLTQLPLARHAFEQGLECNPNHWPCIDNLITVLYALNNYEVCLYYIAKALERDGDYTKALVFRQKIFSEQRSLRYDFIDLFQKCDPSADCFAATEEELEEFVSEALEIRKKKQELSRPPEPAVLKLPRFTAFTWKILGENLISLYESIAAPESTVSFTSMVDLAEYLNEKPVAVEESISMEKESNEVLQVDTSQSSSLGSVAPVSTVTQVSAASHQTVVTVSASLPSLLMMAPSNTVEATPSGPTEQVSADLLTSMEVDEVSTGPKRGPKRKRFSMSDDPGAKRRSARVRGNTTKKQEEVISLQELLIKFLPSSLRTVNNSLDAEKADISSASQPEIETEQTNLDSQQHQKPLKKCALSDTEQTEVMAFLKRCNKNSGVIELINKYLVCLAKKVDVVWPDGLADVYLKGYTRIRKHFDYPSLLGCDVPAQHVNDLANMCLMWIELKLDQWLINRACSVLSPGSSPIKSPGQPACLGPDFPGQYYESDLCYLVSFTCSEFLQDESCDKFSIRVFWARARFFILQNKMAAAVDSFDRTSQYLSYVGEEKKKREINLPHCKMNNIITSDDVKKQLESLQRCQSLEEVQRLHDKGEHETVVDLLLPTFTQPQHTKDKVMEGVPERHAQLILLQDSLLRLDDNERCLLWGEASLNEALQHYRNAKYGSKDDWVSTMTQLFTGLDRCLSKDSGIISTLPSANLVRFTSNLMQIIDLAMDVPESMYEMAVPTALPWILLYRLIEHEERKLKSLASEMDSDLSDCMQSSLMLLNVAHEYLGRRCWCVISDGALLQFTVHVIMEELRKTDNEKQHPFKEELEQSLEQCFYCLYGHPNKRTKAKHLHDHNVPQITLTWERATEVFEYFKPKNVPEFDSYKTSTVSAELENLLRRISLLVPAQENPANTIDSVTAYIEGSTNSHPYISEDKPVTLPIVKELYYLLADYYFKNKEQGKAIKFYVHDLCVNPDRFDSWAGMALARSSRLEQKLNSHELKTEGPTQKHAISALRCFKHALELDSSNSKLWIEYGSLAYHLHSHTARQLKQHHAGMFSLSAEVLELSTNSKKEMLRIAENCYLKASQNDHECDESEEEWLPQYMLGKLAEKMQQPVADILEHYKKAAYYLHEDYANYPKKITYIYSPPRLAVEALEMYYRLHVTVLKRIIHDKEVTDIDVCEKYLQQAVESPFSKNIEKKAQPKERDTSTSQDEDEQSTEVSSASFAMTTLSTSKVSTKKKPTYHCTPQDHDYSKQKSIDSSSADESSVDMMRSPCILDMDWPMKDSSHAQKGRDDGSYPVAARTQQTSEKPVPHTNQASAVQQFSMGNILGDVITKELLSPKESQQPSSTTSNVTAPATDIKNKKSFDIVYSNAKSDTLVETAKHSDQSGDAAEDLVNESDSQSQEEPMETSENEKQEGIAMETLFMTKLAPLNVPDKSTEINVMTLPGSTAFDYKTNPKKLEPEECETMDPNEVEEKTDNEKAVAVITDIDSSSQGSGFLPDDVAEELEKLKAQLLDLESDVPLEPNFSSICMEDLISQKSQDSQMSEHMNRASMSVSDDQSSSQTSAVANDELEKLKAQILDLESCMQSPKLTTCDDAFPAAFPKNESLSASSVEDIAKQTASVDMCAEQLTSTSDIHTDHLSLKDDNGPPVLSRVDDEVPIASFNSRNEDKCSEVASVKSENLKDNVLKADVVGKVGSVETSQYDVAMSSPVKEDLDNNTTPKTTTNVTTIESAHIKNQSHDSDTELVLSHQFPVVPSADSSADRTVSSACHHPQSTRNSNPVDKITLPKDIKTENVADDTFMKSTIIDLSAVKEESMETTTALKEDKEGSAFVKQKGKTVSAESSTVPASVNSINSRMVISAEQTHDDKLGETVERSGNPMDLLQPDDEKLVPKQVEEKEICEKTPSHDHSDDKHGNEEVTSEEKKSVRIEIVNENEKDSEKVEKISETTESKLDEEKRKKLIDQCVAAFRLCLSRFPQHFKSLYRLAYVYYHSADHKDLEKCCDLLLGNSSWQQKDFMPSTGLFQNRNQTNFFNGIWRVPIEEIDRPGNFATHIMRSMLLLVDVLREMKNHNKLFYVHLQMQRSPDLGKKYLRDTDRLHISKMAFDGCMDIINNQLDSKEAMADVDVTLKMVLDVYKIWQHGIKNVPNCAHRLNDLLRKTYKVHTKQPDMPTLEQVARFCQTQALHKPPITPTHTDGTKSNSITPSGLFSSTSKVPSPSQHKGEPRHIDNTQDNLAITDPRKLTSAVQSQISSMDLPEPKSAISRPAGITPTGMNLAIPVDSDGTRAVKPQSPVRLGTEDVKKLIRPCSVKLQPPTGYSSSPGRTNLLSPSKPRSPQAGPLIRGNSKPLEELPLSNSAKKLDFRASSCKTSHVTNRSSSGYTLTSSSTNTTKSSNTSASRTWPKYSSQAKYFQSNNNKDKSLSGGKKSISAATIMKSKSSEQQVLREMLPSTVTDGTDVNLRPASVSSYTSSKQKPATISHGCQPSSSVSSSKQAPPVLTPQLLFPGLTHGLSMSVLSSKNLPLGSVFPMSLGLGLSQMTSLDLAATVPATASLSNQMLLQQHLLTTNPSLFMHQQSSSSEGQSSAQKLTPKSTQSTAKMTSKASSGQRQSEVMKAFQQRPGSPSSSSSDSDVILISSSSQDSSSNED